MANDLFGAFSVRYSWHKVGLFILTLSLWGCSALENSLAPDPKLSQQPAVLGGDRPVPNLPQDFPAEIPIYPDAKLMQSEPNSTVWAIADSVNLLEAFYQKTFAEQGWQIIEPQEPAPENVRQLVAQKNDLEVTLSFSQTAQAEPKTSERAVTGTTFVLDYRAIGSQPDGNQAATPDIAPVEPDANNGAVTTPEPVADLVKLGVFSAADFQPNEIISRRQFARWLLEAHNKIYGDRQNQQIRLAPESSKPVFTDVPAKHPDFAVIQGLAEAGLIPSSLTNDTNALTFRPDAPLTRETLIAWKVPLDRRQALPKASLENIAETWGFQDAAQIETRAIQALYVDFQNGDKANVRRIFGYTTLFQPKKNVTQQEAAIALWYFGYQGDGLSAADALKTPPAQPAPAPESTPEPAPTQP